MYRQFNSSLVSSSYQNTLKCAVAAVVDFYYYDYYHCYYYSNQNRYIEQIIDIKCIYRI